MCGRRVRAAGPGRARYRGPGSRTPHCDSEETRRRPRILVVHSTDDYRRLVSTRARAFIRARAAWKKQKGNQARPVVVTRVF